MCGQEKAGHRRHMEEMVYGLLLTGSPIHHGPFGSFPPKRCQNSIISSHKAGKAAWTGGLEPQGPGDKQHTRLKITTRYKIVVQITSMACREGYQPIGALSARKGRVRNPPILAIDD